MLDLLHLPSKYPNGDVQAFALGGSGVVGSRQQWIKPRGKTMCHILVIGGGGNGGQGAIGAASAAAGGGGGGSGAQTSLIVPLGVIPDCLYLTAATNGSLYVSVGPSTAGSETLAYAGGGGVGGNAAGATAGAAGSAGVAGSVTTMMLGWQWVVKALAGQAGIIGGAGVSGGALTLPATGLLVCGGTGGGGVGAAASTGFLGGGYTVSGAFPAHAGGKDAAGQTTPPGNGSNGYFPINGLLFGYGGTGGGSTGGAATGAGLVQASGGSGAYGCGGGGSGGALTGSTPGQVGLGGLGLCVITSW